MLEETKYTTGHTYVLGVIMEGVLVIVMGAVNGRGY